MRRQPYTPLIVRVTGRVLTCCLAAAALVASAAGAAGAADPADPAGATNSPGPPPAAAATERDPLNSPACREAMDHLRAQESAALADAHERGPLEAVRQRAARACLGSRLDRPVVPGREAQPPISVPSAAPLRPHVAQGTAVTLPAAAAPPARAEPLRTITACDALGCWASDGTRLQRQGPALLGPRGYCSSTGTVLNCP